MNLKRNLGKIVLASTVGLGLVGCSNPEYHFDGMLGEDKVKFYEIGFLKDDDYLEVIKPDGRKIVYEVINDLFTNHIISVEITSQGVTKRYEVGRKDTKEIVEVAQKQFDEYLKKILETKKQEGLKNLK